MSRMPVKDIGTAALFAGTTEGRLLAERLAGGPVKVHVFVATEYGGEGLPQAENILVHEGRMDQEEIREELSRLPVILCWTPPIPLPGSCRKT